VVLLLWSAYRGRYCHSFMISLRRVPGK
jgi:hypothetical protein